MRIFTSYSVTMSIPAPALYSMRLVRKLFPAEAPFHAIIVAAAVPDLPPALFEQLAGQRLESVALAVLIELPLASLCVWLSHHTQQVAEWRIVLLRRNPKRAARGP